MLRASLPSWGYSNTSVVTSMLLYSYVCAARWAYVIIVINNIFYGNHICYEVINLPFLYVWFISCYRKTNKQNRVLLYGHYRAIQYAILC